MFEIRGAEACEGNIAGRVLMLEPHAHAKFVDLRPLPGAARTTAGRRRRAMVSTACVTVAVACWLIAGTRGRHHIYDPGPLSSAHALWQNDCSRCHDNDSKGGFRAAVSDAACLRCHQATAHSPKQLLRQAGNAHSPLALAMPDGHGGLQAAGCTTCHVEHRGTESFALVSDSHCTRCHQNLRRAIQPDTKLESSPHVTAFDTSGGHPYFGKQWTCSGELPRPPAPLNEQSLTDPTHLKFNHKVHNREVKPAPGEASNCTVCHTDRDPTISAGAQARKYMLPVSYERHCQSCHPLNLPSGVAVSHAAMEIVETELISLPELHRQRALRLDPQKQQDLLHGSTLETWSQHSTAAVQEVVSNWLLEMSPKNAHGAEEVAKAIQELLPQDERTGTDPRALTLYMAFGAHDQPGVKSTSCAKCHEMEDVLTARSKSVPSTQGTMAEIPVLRTLPTGIPPSVRRWFLHSRFDHRAHQGLECLTCHSRAAGSEKTTDLLLPNLTWRDVNGATLSCAQCHHPGGSEAAPSHCTTCHTFHDGGPSAAPPRQNVLQLLRGNPPPAAAPSPAVATSNAAIRN